VKNAWIPSRGAQLRNTFERIAPSDRLSQTNGQYSVTHSYWISVATRPWLYVLRFVCHFSSQFEFSDANKQPLLIVAKITASDFSLVWQNLANSLESPA
jgi:hypothetical protein